MRKKFLRTIVVCIIGSTLLVGCGSNKQEAKVEEQQKQEQSQKEKKDTEKYNYILESNKSYEELNNEEQGVNYLYMNKLISGEAKYDDKYKDRVETLRKQKQEKDDKINAEKKSKMDAEYGHISVAQNKEEAIQKVKTQVVEKLNTTKFANKYEVNVLDSFVSIVFDGSVKKSDVVKGELTSMTREIYDYFTQAGLARTDTEVKPLSVYFTIEGEKFGSTWTLGQSPKDDWNNN